MSKFQERGASCSLEWLQGEENLMQVCELNGEAKYSTSCGIGRAIRFKKNQPSGLEVRAQKHFRLLRRSNSENSPIKEANRPTNRIASHHGRCRIRYSPAARL